VTTGLDRPTVCKAVGSEGTELHKSYWSFIKTVNVHTLCSKKYTKNPVVCLYFSFSPVKECTWYHHCHRYILNSSASFLGMNAIQKQKAFGQAEKYTRCTNNVL